MHLCKLILAALISKSFNAKMRNTIAMLTWVNKLEYVIDKRGWLVLTQKNSLALQVNWPSTFTSRSYGTIYIGTLLVYFWKALTIPFLKCFPYTFHLFLYCVIPGYISIFSIKVLVPIDIFGYKYAKLVSCSQVFWFYLRNNLVLEFKYFPYAPVEYWLIIDPVYHCIFH